MFKMRLPGCALLLCALAAVTANSSEASVRVVISVDLSRYYSRYVLGGSDEALAVAYLLKDPAVEVLALAAGFASGRTWYQQLLSTHPCQAAKQFLAEVGHAQVPVVCGSKTGAFLNDGQADESLAGLIGQGRVTWLALDSWAAAAAATLPSLKTARLISELVLPAPTAQAAWATDAEEGNFVQVTDVKSAQLLRSWQQANGEGLPRLAIIGSDSEAKAAYLENAAALIRSSCEDSWLDKNAIKGMIHTKVFKPFPRHIFNFVKARFWESIASYVLGWMSFFVGENVEAVLAAISISPSEPSGFRRDHCLALPMEQHKDEIHVPLPEPCGRSVAMLGPEDLYLRVEQVQNSSLLLSRAVSVLCNVKPAHRNDEL